jgi:Ran GTPase-activating protein (RanGAP) involved in mRNA processing and transport
VLKLDYNSEIGNAGVAILAESLRKNKVLSMVSLAYCGITAEGAQSLFEVLIYQGSQFELINLSGNQFGNEGIITIFRGLAAAKSLVKAQLCDCGWEDTEEVMAALKLAFSTNKKLARYDFRFNLISDEAVDKFISELVP